MNNTALAFDTLGFANELKESGVPEKQAEIHVRTIARLVSERLATKDDLKALELATKADIKALELSTKADIKALELSTKADIKALELATKADIKALEHDLKGLEANTKRDLKEFEYRITIKLSSILGSILVIGMSTLAVLIKVPL